MIPKFLSVGLDWAIWIVLVANAYMAFFTNDLHGAIGWASAAGLYVKVLRK